MQLSFCVVKVSAEPTSIGVVVLHATSNGDAVLPSAATGAVRAVSAAVLTASDGGPLASSGVTTARATSAGTAILSATASTSAVGSASAGADVPSPPASVCTAKPTSAGTAIPSTSSSVAARRRRPVPARPLRSVTSQAAAEKIAFLAEFKKAYYTEKLAIKRRQHELLETEHAQKMKVLKLQEQIALKQLKQLEE